MPKEKRTIERDCMECGKTIGITVYEDNTYERGTTSASSLFLTKTATENTKRQANGKGTTWLNGLEKTIHSSIGSATTVLAHEKTVSMEFHEFKQILEEEVGERSELSKGSYEVGRKLAHLPD